MSAKHAATHPRRPVHWLLLIAAFLVMAVTFATPASAAPSVAPSSSSVGASAEPIVLGAPSAPAVQPNPALSATTVRGLFGCPGFVERGCDFVQGAAELGFACTAMLFWDRSKCGEEAADVADAALDLVGAGVSAVHRKVVQAINRAVQQVAIQVSEFVLGSLLADDNPLSSPDVTQGWFVEQAALMRTIGVYFVAPLMMLVVMQAIVKGSMFFLLRSALVLLPVAILGSVMVIKGTDLMINIADDMSAAIAGTVLSDRNVGGETKSMLEAMDPDTMGFFSLIWLVMMIFGFVAILIELLLRETGIYLAAFFLPFAFAALVWPSTSKWARRMVEVLLGLIFSKVFITAALTLGIAGMSNVDPTSTGGEIAIAQGAETEKAELAANEQATSSAAAMTAILILAAFAGAKIMSISPGGDAALNQGRLANTSAAWSKGQAVSAGAGSAARRAGKMAGGVKPTGAFVNKLKP